MKTISITDELFEQLKEFVVDPYEDTPETIVERLVDIVSKAKRRWNPEAESIAEGTTESSEENASGFRTRPIGAGATAL